MVREKWRSMLASCCHGTSYVPDKRLGQLLQQWGGDEEEGTGLTEKEGGERERRLKVLGEDLTAEELKEVLQVRHFKFKSGCCAEIVCCSHAVLKEALHHTGWNTIHILCCAMLPHAVPDHATSHKCSVATLCLVKVLFALLTMSNPAGLFVKCTPNKGGKGAAWLTL